MAPHTKNNDWEKHSRSLSRLATVAQRMRDRYDKLSDKEKLQLEDIEAQLAQGGAKPCEDAGMKKNEPEVIPRGKKKQKD